ncbi:MAG: hypothetical protein HYX48_05685 [Chlamydiales bacterium]|nr:hypothetical protein [Chlamydiales bacterium]
MSAVAGLGVSGSNDSGLKTAGKVVVALAGAALLVYIIYEACRRNQVQEECSSEDGVVSRRCLSAVVTAGAEVVQDFTPVAVACAAQPFSVPCASAAGQLLYRRVTSHT